jgi:hypothetical protein
MDSVQLKKLQSNYNLHIELSDKKFYKKYNYKIAATFTFRIDHIDNLDIYGNIIENLRCLSLSDDLKIRVERDRIQIYLSDTEKIYNLITSYQKYLNFYLLSYYIDNKDNKSYNVKYRKRPVSHPWEVCLRRGVSKKSLEEFYRNHSNELYLDKHTRWEILGECDIKWTLYNPPLRENTWGTSLYRFTNETLMNYFLFQFGEYIQNITYYEQQKVKKHEFKSIENTGREKIGYFRHRYKGTGYS